MLFLEAILLSTLSKMSNHMVKTSIFSWDPILLDSAPLNYVKMSGFKALLKIAPNLLFFFDFPLVYSFCRQFSFFKSFAVWTEYLPIIKATHLNSPPFVFILIHGFYAVSNPGWLEFHVFNWP